ncbi:MAG: SCO family protein [Myxococcota bacterium]
MRSRAPRKLLRASTIALFVACGGEAPLPELAEVPAIELTAQDGSAFSTASLRGKVWIAGFIFTTCPSVCPMITTQMGNLERKIEGDLHFVSFTVDPVHDNPEVLRRYAETHSANLARWTFLTGEEDAVRRAIQDGLKVRMGERAGNDITHGTHLVLVDKTARIRGFYRTDADGLRNLERDARRLLE